ncbi:MAG: glycosyltransferase family 2 protein, partial [Desulfobacterales bacterium]|nr:glycosyltransferase family 2 protein [Desulfobacterales bacterium]
MIDEILDLVSVIIVNWNGRKFLPECLESLTRQAYRRFSIIFVDNGSNDGSIDFLKRNYPKITTIALPKNVGFSVANNIAIKAVDTEYVALLNNDAVADSLWLQSLIGALKSYPEAGFAASKMLFYDNPGIIDRTGDGYTRAGTGLLRGRAEPASSYNKQEW